jgi:hypothetical protein
VTYGSGKVVAKSDRAHPYIASGEQPFEVILFLEELSSVFDHCREPTTNSGVNILSSGSRCDSGRCCQNLWEDFHATPEGDMIFDRSRFFRLGIEPGGILIGPVADPDVARNALPGTGGVGVAWSKIFPLDRIRRKIVIALYDNGLIDSAMIVSSQVAFMKPSL